MLPPCILTEVKLLQFEKASFPIVFTDLGITSCCIAVSLNASLPIEVTVNGIIIDGNEVQPLKVELPIEVTERGMLMVVNSLQPLNAESPIVSSPPPSIETVVKLAHPLNAPLPIVLTVFGIVIDTSPEPAKALSKIAVTEEGIIIDGNEVQP